MVVVAFVEVHANAAEAEHTFVSALPIRSPLQRQPERQPSTGEAYSCGSSRKSGGLEQEGLY